MKKILSSILAVVLLCVFSLFALGSLEKEEVDVTDNVVADYAVDIGGYRIVKDYNGADIIIIKYSFTNNSDDAKSFSNAINETVFQGGIELDETFVLLSEGMNYNFYDNKSKKIKSGMTVDIEAAYKLNDTTTELEIEIKDGSLFSNDKDVIDITLAIQ